jgi:hypothetical protein
MEGSKFLTIRTIDEFQIQAERSLNKRFDLDESRIYFIDYKNKKLYRHDHKTKERLEYSINVGLIGKAIGVNKELNIENCYNDSDYNTQVDLSTTLPIHVRPLRHPESNKVVIGCL